MRASTINTKSKDGTRFIHSNINNIKSWAVNKNNNLIFWRAIESFRAHRRGYRGMRDTIIDEVGSCGAANGQQACARGCTASAMTRVAFFFFDLPSGLAGLVVDVEVDVPARVVTVAVLEGLLLACVVGGKVEETTSVYVRVALQLAASVTPNVNEASASTVGVPLSVVPLSDSHEGSALPGSTATTYGATARVSSKVAVYA